MVVIHVNEKHNEKSALMEYGFINASDGERKQLDEDTSSVSLRTHEEVQNFLHGTGLEGVSDD